MQKCGDELLYYKNNRKFEDVCNGVYGRKVIKSPVKEITDANIISVLSKALPIHFQNRTEIDYLDNYYRGNQPVLYRQKKVRPEINNKIVENHALEIVRFMTAQNYGEPIQYVSRNDNKEITKEIDRLNDFMSTRSKAKHDIDIGEWQSICGTAYRLIWSDKHADTDLGEAPFDMEASDPRYNFIVYSNGNGSKPLMSVTQRKDEDNQNMYYCYTNQYVYVVKKNKVVDKQINGYGRIILIEYPNNSRRLSDIEIVITLLDAINNTQSDRQNGIQQFVQAFMKFINCEIEKDQFLEMIELGAIKIKAPQGVQADVDLVASELDQQNTQLVKDDLYKTALIIEGMPNREQNTGGDTGQAVYLRNGWDFAEQRAKLDEPLIEMSEKESLKIFLKILKTKGLISKDLKLTDIKVQITRNKTDNMLVKSQSLKYLLDNRINPKIAIATCGLFSDPEKVYVQSKPYLDVMYQTKDEIDAEAKKARQMQDTQVVPEGGE